MRLVVIIAAAAALVVTDPVAQVSEAEACGVKLTVKAPRVKKRVKRSTNPSRILLLGSPPRKLASRLSDAGHRVDVARSSEQTPSKRYALIVADPDKVDDARAQFPGTRVVTRSSSLRSNLKRVEQSLGRPAPARTRVAAAKPKPKQRQARRAKPAPRPALDKVGRKPDRVESDPTPEPEPVEQPAQPEPEPEPEDPDPEPAPDIEFTEEFFFATNQSRLSREQRAQLAANVKWLKANPDATLTIEGHTDAAGSAAYNMKLSRKRARSVRAYLTRRGIARSRIAVSPFGEERPAYSDDDSKNRRVFLVRK